MNDQNCTDLRIVAKVARIVSTVVDQITGDRSDYPLLVASATVEALKKCGVESRVIYGQAAWVEVLENEEIVWAGCWGENVHLWAGTEFGEVVDLNTSVAYRKKAHQSFGEIKALYSPPMIWSKEVPAFCRYSPEGVAELTLDNERDQKWFQKVNERVLEAIQAEPQKEVQESDFPNEPILCPMRKLLDDSQQTFRHFDRILSIKGIPKSPF